MFLLQLDASIRVEGNAPRWSTMSHLNRPVIGILVR